MRLDPAGASVAATRRRRNFARGLEPLHPAHCARYAHFEMRGRLIARQPAQHHRLNHALAKIVGKTHPRRPHSRSVNEEAEINRFGNPPTDSIRSDTALKVVVYVAPLKVALRRPACRAAPRPESICVVSASLL